MLVKCQIVGCNQEGLAIRSIEWLKATNKNYKIICENEYVMHIETCCGEQILIKHKLEENPYIKPLVDETAQTTRS